MSKFNRELLKESLLELPKWKLVLFSLLCAERIETSFWAFARRENRQAQLDLFEECSEWAWRSVGEEGSHVEALRMYDVLKRATHDSEEFGDALAVQAQSAAIAMMYTLRIDGPSGLDSATWAAQSVIEAIHNFVMFSAEACGYQITEEFDNSMLDRELKKQWEDLQLLRSMGQLQKSVIPALRTRNRLFAIPIAV